MRPFWPASGFRSAGSACFRCSCSLGPAQSLFQVKPHPHPHKLPKLEVAAATLEEKETCLGYKMLLIWNFMFWVASKLLGCVSVAFGALVAHLG